MNIALIFPRYKYPSGDTPLGILYVATYLKSYGASEVDVIDTTFHKTCNKLLGLIKAKQYDVIGLSLMTTMLKDAQWIAAAVKRINPKTRIVFGGPHPTAMPTQSLNDPNVDAVAIGEGEETWLELANKSGRFEGIKGLWYKEDGQVIKNKLRGPIEELDKLPFPNLELVDLHRYFKHWWQLDSVDTSLRGINIMSSRGCPYNCSFCQPTLDKLFGKRMRMRSPENIVEELKHWKKKQGINACMFQDDTLIFDKEWVSHLCDCLINAKLNLKWGCNVRANLVDYKTIAKMKKAGLRKIFMGIESGSQRVLDRIYHKGITISQVKDSVKTIKSLDLKIQGYFMLGAPTETMSEVEQTIRLARTLDIDEATFSITTPLPETHLYEETKHLICEDITEFDYYKIPVFKGDSIITQNQLKKLKQHALLSFYLSPRRLLSTLDAFARPTAMKKSFLKLRRF